MMEWFKPDEVLPTHKCIVLCRWTYKNGERTYHTARWTGTCFDDHEGFPYYYKPTKNNDGSDIVLIDRWCHIPDEDES